MKRDKLLKLLKDKKFVIGVPVVVKFRRIGRIKFHKYKATKGTEVIKWSDLLKALRRKK
jgi:hypothetical protein